MTTIEAQKAELERKMVAAEEKKAWATLADLAVRGGALDPDWFAALCFLQAAAVELELQVRPGDPYAQLAAHANRRVRELADKQGQ